MSDFLEYFADTTEYPFGNGVPENLLPMNELYVYVSSTLINGFLNYGKRLDARLMSRYYKFEEKFDEEKIARLDPPNRSMDRERRYTSKKEILDLFQEGWRMYHTSLDIFQDDVALLTWQQNHYLFLYCDRDVSDCMIGRFKTRDYQEDVLYNFRDWTNIKSQEDTQEKSITIPLDWIQGWVSF